MAVRGGKREGAGRKPGSKTLKLLELLQKKGKKTHKNENHYIEEFLDFLLENYMEDTRLMVWMGEHIFGKPTQMHSGDPDNQTPIPIMHVQRNNGGKEGSQPH